jgi:putative oxidoreductase
MTSWLSWPNRQLERGTAPLDDLGLLCITFVAVYTVHFDLGWASWNQIDSEDGLGFKVPLMLALMLLAVLTQGPGRYAANAWVVRRVPVRG